MAKLVHKHFGGFGELGPEQEMSVSRSPMARREGGTGVETSEGIKWPRNL